MPTYTSHEINGVEFLVIATDGDVQSNRLVLKKNDGTLIDLPLSGLEGNIPIGTYSPAPGSLPKNSFGAPAVMGPRPTGIAATDRSNLAQAIGDTRVGERLVIPSDDTFFVIDEPLIVDKHLTINGDAISTLLGETISGLVPEYPYVVGTVIKQVSEGENILNLTGVGATVNLKNLGLIFSQDLETTGHGINCEAVGGLSNFSLYASFWESIYVAGHDGDHYGYRLINYILDTFNHCHSYGGGGWRLESRAAQFAGNGLWFNPYVGLINVGSAGAYDQFCEMTDKLNGNTFIQPIAFISGDASDEGTQAIWDETLGGSIPFRCITIGAQLQSNGVNPVRQSVGTQFIAPGQCNVRSVTNTITGIESDGDLTEQLNQTAYGYQAMKSATEGSQQNSAFGTQTLKNLTTGLLNTAVGFNALGGVTSQGGGTAVGANALSVATGLRNTAVGCEALKSATSATENVGGGYQSLTSLTTGNNNVAIGTQALYSATSSNENTALGMQSGALLTTGSNNTLVGGSTGLSLVVGSGCTLVGQNAGTGSIDVNFATALGNSSRAKTNALALGFNTEAFGNGSVAIGMDNTSVSASTSVDNVIALGTALHILQLKNNAVGSGTPSFGSNCPAVNPTSSYTWIKMISSDGSTVFVPSWK